MNQIKSIAFSLNLFKNYKTDFKQFTMFEAYFTYIFITLYICSTSIFAYFYYSTEHYAHNCGINPSIDTICPSSLTLCSCKDNIIHNICNIENISLSSCSCCWYSIMTQKTNTVIFITQLGGLYTAMLGISGLLMCCIKYFRHQSEEDMADASSISISLS